MQDDLVGFSLDPQRDHGAQHSSRAMTLRSPSSEEQALKAEQHRVWQQEVQHFLMTYPFTARLVMRLSLMMVVDDRVPTACTDGERVFVNAHFASRCTSALRRFVLGHELYHVLLGHFQRQFGRDPLRWNLAVDAEVNYKLLCDGFSLPHDAVLYPAQAGKSAEAIYQWLLAHPQPEVDTPFDHHGNLLAPPIAGHRDGTMVVDNDYRPVLADSQRARQLTQQWQQTVQRVSETSWPGSVPCGMEQMVHTDTVSRVPWRHVLADIIHSRAGGSPSWQRPHRRHWGYGRYLPGRYHKTLRLVVAIDSSASTRRYWARFLGELQVLLVTADRVDLHVIEADAAIHRERSLSSLHELNALADEVTPEGMTLMGGGGTDFRPVFERVEALVPDCLVYLTDGRGRMPTQPPSVPVFWVMPEAADLSVSWGHIVVMEET